MLLNKQVVSTQRRLLWTVLPLFLLLLTSFTLADTQRAEGLQALTWLAKMQNAMLHQSYEGVLVYDRGTVMSTLKVIHRFYDGRVQERIIQLDGERGEVLRDGQNVYCVLPGNRIVRVDQTLKAGSFSGNFAKEIMPKLTDYMMSVVGMGRVAGHDAVKVAAIARDNNRFNYLFWLEKNTGLLIKSRILNHAGKVLESFQYTTLNLSPVITSQDLKPALKGTQVTHKNIPEVNANKNWSSAMQWKPMWIPKGFNLVSRSASKIKDGVVQVYSDGLASFSIFIEKPGPKSLPEGVSQIGGTLAFAHQFKRDNHDYMGTVIGEIPSHTAKKIAMSIIPTMAK